MIRLDNGILSTEGCNIYYSDTEGDTVLLATAVTEDEADNFCSWFIQDWFGDLQNTVDHWNKAEQEELEDLSW